MTVLEWVYYAKFGARPPVGGPELDKELRRLERARLIYYDQVDGRPCHRRLTAAGAEEVNRARQGLGFRLLIPAG
jgi:hypothetical protein